MDFNNKSLLFVCYGNTCRSPMAEYLMKEICRRRGIDAHIYSRGLYVHLAAKDKTRASEEACIVMEEVYLSTQIRQHVPVHMNLSDILSADIVLAMEQGLCDTIIRTYRRRREDELQRKVFALKEFAGFTEDLDVEDPIGLDFHYTYETAPVNGKYRLVQKIKHSVIERYRSCRDEIKAGIERILENPEPDVDALLKNRTGWGRFKKAMRRFQV
ncbi:MAG: hypothetical protein QME12_05690 [Nanoarchaeota archaeon]|nr:hypothetical protein [Nanoarchaeota archaeon]